MIATLMVMIVMRGICFDDPLLSSVCCHADMLECRAVFYDEFPWVLLWQVDCCGIYNDC